jgi:hypothetical protein
MRFREEAGAYGNAGEGSNLPGISLPSAKKRGVVGEDAPVNSAGGGNIAGIGVGPKGEPGVHPKHQAKNKSPILFPDMIRRSEPNNIVSSRRKGQFAGATVFEVNSKLFHSLTLAKRKGKHWRTYLEEDDCYAEIREWANKNKGPIIVRNENTGEMRHIRYGR